MTFKHIVGKSTFEYGFTIPKQFHASLEIPEKGERRKVELLYGKEQRVEVWLYRAKNSTGSLQIRYDGKYGENFKNWLREIFTNSTKDTDANINEYVEVHILNDFTFLLKE